jgi:hypothetical protein
MYMLASTKKETVCVFAMYAKQNCAFLLCLRKDTGCAHQVRETKLCVLAKYMELASHPLALEI